MSIYNGYFLTDDLIRYINDVATISDLTATIMQNNFTLDPVNL